MGESAREKWATDSKIIPLIIRICKINKTDNYLSLSEKKITFASSAFTTNKYKGRCAKRTANKEGESKERERDEFFFSIYAHLFLEVFDSFAISLRQLSLSLTCYSRKAFADSSTIVSQHIHWLHFPPLPIDWKIQQQQRRCQQFQSIQCNAIYSRLTRKQSRNQCISVLPCSLVLLQRGERAREREVHLVIILRRALSQSLALYLFLFQPLFSRLLSF